jgi:exopolyphosphatase/pppGpp-phosphohydrolase
LAACVDLGSSYFRLLVAEVSLEGTPRRITPHFEDLRYVGWGEEVHGRGFISAVSMERAAAALNALVG